MGKKYEIHVERFFCELYGKKYEIHVERSMDIKFREVHRSILIGNTRSTHFNESFRKTHETYFFHETLWERSMKYMSREVWILNFGKYTDPY